MESVVKQEKEEKKVQRPNNGLLYLSELFVDGIEKFGKNLRGEVRLGFTNGRIYPQLILNQSNKEKSYLISPITQFTSFIKEELTKSDVLNGLQKGLYKITLSLLNSYLTFVRLDEVVYVNNFLLSTNLYDKKTERDAFTITNELKKQCPKKAIIFKSVDERINGSLLKTLEELNYTGIVSRQIYICNPAEEKLNRKRNYMKDVKHWEKHKDGFVWEEVRKISNEDAEKLIVMYNDLYIRKYNKYNPQYTVVFLQMVAETKIMSLFTLRYKGELVGCSVFFQRSNTITTPFIAYDMQQPKSLGLYRILNLKLMERAIEKNLILNMSSGAGDFKKKRGGKACFEYNMVYTEHLSKNKKMAWKLMQILSEKVAKPGMLRHGF